MKYSLDDAAAELNDIAEYIYETDPSVCGNVARYEELASVVEEHAVLMTQVATNCLNDIANSIPEGYKAVGFRVPAKGEYYLNYLDVKRCRGHLKDFEKLIIEKIEG